MLPPDIQAALDFEKASWATGSVSEDPFYTVQSSTADSPAGTLLKVEEDANATAFTLPPNTAISRFIYQSKRLDGLLVPVSAYILWPYSPRSQADGYQVVAWAHGTSGITDESAPSHFSNLWQHYLAPYQLALQGYVVVATDYAGLGVGKDSNGKAIVHEYIANPAAANDVIYSVSAAREAFPSLSKEFVVIGHSQGGGAAWATAQRNAIEATPGYLGAVAISPVTTTIELPDPTGSFLAAIMSESIAGTFPDFKTSDIIQPPAQQALKTLHEVKGCGPVAVGLLTPLFIAGALLEPDWKENVYVRKFQDLVANGGKKIAGPLLVIHGQADANIDVNLIIAAVNETVSLFPSSEINFHLLPKTSHVATPTGSQHVWMDWIADRFAGRQAKPYQGASVAVPARPASSYSPELNWYIERATKSFHAP